MKPVPVKSVALETVKGSDCVSSSANVTGDALAELPLAAWATTVLWEKAWLPSPAIRESVVKAWGAVVFAP